jgi:glycosyltransferase 2 family protein
MKSKKILAILNVLVLCVGVFSISYYVYRQFVGRPIGVISINFWLMGFSLLLSMFYSISYGLGWHFINRTMGIIVPLWVDFTIWGYSLLGKFTPMNIVLFSYRVSTYSIRFKAKLPQITSSLAMESLMSIFSGGALLLALTITYNVMGFDWSFLTIRFFSAATMIVVLVSFFAIPTVRRRIVTVLRFEFAIAHISWLRLIGIFVYYTLAWLFICSSFYVLCLSIGTKDITWPVAASAYLFAGLSGIIAVFAPSGIGIREGILVAILGHIIPVEQALALALLSRVNSLLGDLVGIALGVAGLRAGALQESK